MMQEKVTVPSAHYLVNFIGCDAWLDGSMGLVYDFPCQPTCLSHASNLFGIPDWHCMHLCLLGPQTWSWI